MIEVTADVGGPPQPPPPPPVQRRGRLGVLSINSTQGETISELFPQTPAAAAGLQLGDVITSVDGFKVGMFEDNVYSLPSEIRRSQGQVKLTVLRRGQELTFPVDLGLPTHGIATRARVLLIALTNDKKVGKACTANLEFMTARVREAFQHDPQLLDLRVLSGDGVTADNVLRLIDQTTVTPTETLFCYYCGHGAYDPRFAADDPSFGHLLQIPGEDLLRRSLRDHLIEKAARLTVLITDTCNVRVQTRRELQPRGTPPNEAEKPLYGLLMRHSGVVDISGTSRDEFGWATADGCLFSISLNDCLDNSGATTWQELLNSVVHGTDDRYQSLRDKLLASPALADSGLVDDIRKQKHQTPESFILSVQPVIEEPQ